MGEGILAASRWEARVSELPGVRSRSSTEKQNVGEVSVLIMKFTEHIFRISEWQTLFSLASAS